MLGKANINLYPQIPENQQLMYGHLRNKSKGQKGR